MLTTLLTYLSPCYAAFALFLCYFFTGKRMEVSNVYTAYALLNITRMPLMTMPMSYAAVYEAAASFKRLSNFFLLKEIDTRMLIKAPEEVVLDASMSNSSTEYAVSMENATFTWDVDSPIPTLSDISLKIPHGSSVAIIGSVGSGKSSLISAILGQMHSVSGKFNPMVHPSAYVSQDHWIQNLSVQENVCFGDQLEFSAYQDSIEASQLNKDFVGLPHGDYTVVGDQGITLSGGQKARVSIARAIYKSFGVAAIEPYTASRYKDSHCNLFIFDDPFAAVDAHVGRVLFDKGITTLLSGKTRIVALSANYQYLQYFDKIIVMEDGKIMMEGSFAEVAQNFPQYGTVIPNNTFVTGLETVQLNEESVKFEERPSRNNIPKIISEERSTGSVALSTYTTYFSAAVDNNQLHGNMRMISILGLFLTSQAVRIICDVWVGTWATNR